MKFGLPRKAQYPIGVELSRWHLLNPLDVSQTGAVHSLELTLEIGDGAAGRKKQVPVGAREIAIDVFFAHDRFDTIDCSRVAGSAETRTFFTEHFFEVEIAIVERGDEVRGRASGHAAADR